MGEYVEEMARNISEALHFSACGAVSKLSCKEKFNFLHEQGHRQLISALRLKTSRTGIKEDFTRNQNTTVNLKSIIFVCVMSYKEHAVMARF